MKSLVITAPHPTLRKVSLPITKVDQKLKKNIQLLIQALKQEIDPPGVGMAFSQINKSISGFAIRPTATRTLPAKADAEIKVLLNPVIKAHSKTRELGEDQSEPDYEGCLSVPLIYGPVPRWSWLELEFQTIKNDQLITQTSRFTGYSARIVQHEMDHLNGILFTDHLLKLNLPAYVKKGYDFVEIEDRKILQVF